MSTFFSHLLARHDNREYTKALARHMLDDDSRVVVALDNHRCSRRFPARILRGNSLAQRQQPDTCPITSPFRPTNEAPSASCSAWSRRACRSPSPGVFSLASPGTPRRRQRHPLSIPCSFRFTRSSTVPRRRACGLRSALSSANREAVSHRDAKLPARLVTMKFLNRSPSRALPYPMTVTSLEFHFKNLKLHPLYPLAATGERLCREAQH
jgi:hypothetical protein